MSARRVSVVDCPGGPLLIRGADEVVGIDGSAAPAERAVVALCRCGRSERLPWCDDSHRARRRRPKKPTTTDEDSAASGETAETGSQTDD